MDGERDRIYTDVMRRGWNPKVGAFVQHYESEALDAANLIMPIVFFVSPTDPRMISTLNRTMERPLPAALSIAITLIRLLQMGRGRGRGNL